MDRLLPVICESGEMSCSAVVRMTHLEYEDVRGRSALVH
jgi:hypothetical protein